ncbi:MAG: YfhO family protein, partial [Anaerolineae bacterium]|nr:YfhO family protein [Anaerolineae bacterium]
MADAARWVGRVALAGSVGLGLAAVQLLPTAEFLVNSQRASGVDSMIAMTYSMWPWRLLTLWAPNMFGNPGHGDYWGYATYWEDAAYLGVLPLLLSLSAVFTRLSGVRGGRNDFPSKIVFWTVVCVVGFGLALGSNTPVFSYLYQHVPSFDWFQAPARWLAVVTIGLSILSAIGMQLWPPGHQGQRRAILWIVIGAALTIGGVSAPQLEPGVRDTFSIATTRFGILVVISGMLMVLRSVLASRHVGVGTLWNSAVVLLVMADLLVFGWPLIPTVDRSLYGSATELGMLLGESADPVRIYWPRDPSYRDREFDAHERVKFSYLSFSDFGPRDVEHWQGIRQILLPNTGMLENVASVNNYDPMQVAHYHDLMRLIAEHPSLLQVTGATHVITDESWPGGTAVRSGSGVTVYGLENSLGRAWVVPQARYVAADKVLSVLAESGFDPAREVLLDDVTRVRPVGDAAKYTIVLQDAPNRVTISAVLAAPGYLVVADTWYPGWRATVDGRRVDLLRANHTFRAIWLDAGEHAVEMVFRPASVQWGIAVTVATVLGLVIAAVVLSRTR